MKLKDTDSEICQDLSLNLVDTSNNILDTYIFNLECTTEPTVKDFSDILTTPIFQYNFGYNVEKFDTKNAALKLYVQGIKQLVNAGKTVTIVVNSSASKVPTRKYKSNYDLAATRQKNGKNTMIKLLKQYNIPLDKVKICHG